MLSRKSKKVLVNLLSVSRVIGSMFVPVFIRIFSIPAVIAITVILFITDALDGYFARKWNVQTRGGALLDPLGDKMLAVSFIVSFGLDNYILLIPLLLEIAITVLNIDRTMHGEEFKTSIMGKIKTWVLFVTLGLYAVLFLKPDNTLITSEITTIALVITVACQILTISLYIKDSIKKKDMRSKKRQKVKNFKKVLSRLFDEEAFKEDKDLPLVMIIRKCE